MIVLFIDFIGLLLVGSLGLFGGGRVPLRSLVTNVLLQFKDLGL